MADDDRPLPGRPEGTEDVRISTFLIADVRGYTLFTQERGDEAATKLAEVAREVVEEHGSVIELRGDEVVAAFSSVRQAILAATHAQDRFLEETIADPSFPLPVGIGLDAGEAVPLKAGYRGGALNLAARLCLEGVCLPRISATAARLAGKPDSFRSPGRPRYRGLLMPGAAWSPDGQRLAYRFTVLPVDPALDRPEGTVEQTIDVADAVTTAHLLDM